MQAITVVGLALFVFVLYQRARKARTQPRRSLLQRFGTVHVLLAAALAWLFISTQLQHLNRALGGEQPVPASKWERVIEWISDWWK